MPKINEAERKVQELIIKFFNDKDSLNYRYYGDLRDRQNGNIIPDVLHNFLIKNGHSENLANKAIAELQKESGNLQTGLYDANKRVYSLLKYGAKVKEHAGESEKTIFLIDWENFENNEFAIAEEVTIIHAHQRRPDIVVYINGIAIAVLELKKSTISVSHGIRQNLSNQSKYCNEPFFSTIQFVMAGNNSEGLRYGTIKTEEKYFLEWKNDLVHTDAQPLDNTSLAILKYCENIPDKLLWQLFSMFKKERFLDLLHNFVIFDSGIKKICRHNQFFGVKKAQIKLGRKQGGIIWHTQGSGKTFTMVGCQNGFWLIIPMVVFLLLLTVMSWMSRSKKYIKALMKKYTVLALVLT